jgi:3D (Asp-Asp-Asp) domain-containing protein
MDYEFRGLPRRDTDPASERSSAWRPRGTGFGNSIVMLSKVPRRIVIRIRQSARRRRVRRFLTGVLLIIASGCAGGIHPSAPPAANPDSAGTVPAGKPLSFTATAYCSGTRTASGAKVTEGIAAADPSLVPIGSVIRVSGLERRYNGVYTVMDTGSKVRGRQLDLYVRDCEAATRFGRRPAYVSIVRRGWHPRGTSPTP